MPDTTSRQAESLTAESCSPDRGREASAGRLERGDKWLEEPGALQQPGVLRALFLQFGPWLERRVEAEARKAGLSGEDVADALQEAICTLSEAASRFDAERSGFRTFLGRMVSSRVRDLAKRLRRVRCRLDRKSQEEAVGANEYLDELPDSRVLDPALAAEHDELTSRVRLALAGLGDQTRWLVTQWVAGVPLAELGRQLDVPYHSVRYLWEQTLAQLAAGLRGLAG